MIALICIFQLLRVFPPLVYFGPTNDKVYGPKGRNNHTIRTEKKYVEFINDKNFTLKDSPSYLKDIKVKRTIMIEAMLQNGAMGFIVGAQLFHEIEYITPIAIYALIQYVALMFYIGNINITRVTRSN